MPNVLASDTFTRANHLTSLGVTEVGALPWTALSGVWGIEGNQARKYSPAAVNNAAVLNVGTADHETTWTVRGSGISGAVIRAVDDNNYMLAQVYPNAVAVFQKVAGVFSPLTGSATFPAIAAGSVVTFGVKGLRHYLKINGVEYWSLYTNLFPAATRTGLYAYDLAARFDDFTVRDQLPDVVPVVTHTLENVVAGLAVALDAVPDLRVYPYPADSVAAPAVVLTLPDSPFSIVQGKGESWLWTFPLWLFVGKANDKAAATEVRPYLEPVGVRSIRQAVEVDRSLSGSCDSVSVLSVSTSIASVAGTSFLAAEFTLEVIG